MTKNVKEQNNSQPANESFKNPNKPNGAHKLNIPLDESQMSKADKSTFKAWTYAYKNRDKRVD